QNAALGEAHRAVIERSTAALEALSATVDARDTYTAGHSRRVAASATVIAQELGLSGHELVVVDQAALLHDIGKIGVPDAVLLKEGPLTAAEWVVMRSHPEEGARIIERLGYLDKVVAAFVAAAATSTASYDDVRWTFFVALLAGGALAQLFAAHTAANQVFHTGLAFSVAAALVLPPELVVVVCVLQHVPEWLRQR